nr:MAG TPA_asm: hypothetical protein [Caudoviricetes sp.]
MVFNFCSHYGNSNAAAQEARPRAVYAQQRSEAF